MKNGPCTEPGIQSSVKRSFVGSPAAIADPPISNPAATSKTFRIGSLRGGMGSGSADDRVRAPASSENAARSIVCRFARQKEGPMDTQSMRAFLAMVERQYPDELVRISEPVR